MKPYFPFIILFIFINISTVLSQKKELYVNDNLEEISKTEFDRNTGDDYLNLKFDGDTVYVNISAKRIKKGKISTSELEAIKSNLTPSPTNFDQDDFIVIYYYPGKDAYNSSGNKEMTRQNYQSYLTKVKKYPHIKQFFVYKSVEGTEEYGAIDWLKDKNRLIETLFFSVHYPCNSTLIIDGLGNYYAHRGENNISEIFKIIGKKHSFQNADN